MKLLNNLLLKIKLIIVWKLVEKTENGNLNQSTDKVHTLLTDELDGTLGWSPTMPQLVDDKESEILIMAIKKT